MTTTATTTPAYDTAGLLMVCHVALTRFAASGETQSVYRYLNDGGLIQSVHRSHEDGDLIVLPAGKGARDFWCEVLTTEGFTGDCPPEDLTPGDIDAPAVLMADALAEELAKWEDDED